MGSCKRGPEDPQMYVEVVLARYVDGLTWAAIEEEFGRSKRYLDSYIKRHRDWAITHNVIPYFYRNKLRDNPSAQWFIHNTNRSI